MSATERIAESLPQFYKTWAKDSLISKVLHSFGNPLTDVEKDLFRIMRGHWIDTASGVDIDHLGSIFNLHRSRGETDNAFRRRVKRAIQEYKGGGTVSAVEMTLKNLLGPFQQEVQVIEFPETPLGVTVQASSGDTWHLRTGGIEDITPTIRIALETKGRIQDPRVSNVETSQFIGLRGSLEPGDELVLNGKSGTINGKDVTGRLVTSQQSPIILRGGSNWQYSESLHSKIGVFDSGIFDESIFSTPLPKVGIRFDWVAHKTSTIEVRVPGPVLQRAGLKEDEVRQTLNSIKAGGIEVRLVIEQPSVAHPESQIPLIAPTPTERAEAKPIVTEEAKEIVA